MQTVGNYNVLFRPGYEIVVALTPRTQTRLANGAVPKYLTDYIATHRRHHGYLYLIHFKEPYKHARHYLGFTRDPLMRELRHAAGRGSRLMQVIEEKGIDWKIVRLWYGDRYLERRLKKHSSTRYCPVCNDEISYDDITYEGVMECLNSTQYTTTQSQKILEKSSLQSQS